MHGDDQYNDLNKLAVLGGNGLTNGKPVLKITMMDVTIEVQTIKKGFFRTKLTHVLTIKSSTHNIGIDLLFDSTNKNTRECYNWTKCVQEAKEINRSQINRLTEAKLRISQMNQKLVRQQSSMFRRNLFVGEENTSEMGK